MLKTELDWKVEPNGIQIAITGPKTYIKLAYTKSLWHCEAFYKWTSQWNYTREHGVVSSWSSDSREESINAVVYDLKVQQRNFPSHFRCHAFKFGELE